MTISLTACQTMPVNNNINHDKGNTTSIATSSSQNTTPNNSTATVVPEANYSTQSSPQPSTQLQPITDEMTLENATYPSPAEVSNQTPTTVQNPVTQTSQQALERLQQQQEKRLQEQHQQQLLERARQNSNQTTSTTVNLATPAVYNQLMKKGIQQLRTNQLGEAEATFTHAQRVAPQASAAYFYLGQVALKKNQPTKAEAMARRGLLVANNQDNIQGLWLIILKSAQMTKNDQLIHEAKRALR